MKKWSGRGKTSPAFTASGNLWTIVFIFTMIVYAVGLVVDIMEPDAAIYAQISMEMHDRGDYLSIYHKSRDWLDKPHFPFWMSALSYKIFGVGTVAYKLPAVVFVLLGALYTFLFARRFYSAMHAWLSVLVLITAQHIIISNQDVRAEPFMTGLLIMSLYHFAVYLEPVMRLSAGRYRYPEGGRRWAHAVAGALAVSCLMMTKGLFTIIPVAAGVGFSLMYARKWTAVFDWRWLVIGAMVLAFLSPALYGYYRQFDLHPEKTVFGRNGVSGVEFFLWTSQWGRFTNTGPITGKGDISYFVHTMLWAFLPWAFAGFFALYRKTVDLIRDFRHSSKKDFAPASEDIATTPTVNALTSTDHSSASKADPSASTDDTSTSKVDPSASTNHASASKADPSASTDDTSTSKDSTLEIIRKRGREHFVISRPAGENYTYFGFTALFLVFSFSQFQLSFYLNPLFPLLSILTVAVLLRQRERALKTFSTIHLVLACLLLVVLTTLFYFFFDRIPHADTWLVMGAGLGLGFYLFGRRREYLKKIFFATALICLSVNYFLNREFYPSLLRYQSESSVARYFSERGLPAEKLVFLGNMESVADVILHRVMPVVPLDSVRVSNVGGKYVFTTGEGMRRLDSLGMSYSVVEQFEDFPVTTLTGKFINRKTRSEAVEMKYLLKVESELLAMGYGAQRSALPVPFMMLGKK